VHSEKLESVLHSLRIDDARLDDILKAALKFSESQWSDLRNNEFWFTAEDALKSGMITEIGDFTPPRGQQIFSFNL
jgi:ATP-dependent protease ClpP protease subunit